MNSPLKQVLSGLFVLVPLVVVGVGVAGCGGRAVPAIPTPPTVVVVSTPLRQEVTDYEDFTGRTDAAQSVDLRARVSGYLSKINFKPGDEIEAGELLFEIDPREYQAALDRAEAEAAGFAARVKRSEADFGRAEKLLPSNTITREEYDKIVADRAEAEAAVASSHAKVAQARLDLEFTRVTAPLSGRIGRNLIDVGNLVTADSTLLANIVSVDPLFVYFNIDERTVLRVQRMQREDKEASEKGPDLPVLIRLADEKDYSHRAEVDFIDNRVDPATGTIRVRAEIPNPVVSAGRRRFAAGLFVGVRVPIGRPYQALLVSERALGTDQGQKFVYVVNAKNEVVYRPVRVGRLQDGLRVIEEGLKADERVITSGLQRVRPGVVVEPKVGPMRTMPASAEKPVDATNPARAEARKPE
ncbi:MAG: efflux RND transporter periplasmic adaptor subunit [Rhodopirellula sp.]|mgnify:CR=1 FL=1|nr:efflux RND transporter periplasmic adaptor subunit [Rhodopirellula sp.]